MPLRKLHISGCFSLVKTLISLLFQFFCAWLTCNLVLLVAKPVESSKRFTSLPAVLTVHLNSFQSVLISKQKISTNIRINGKTRVITVIDSVMMLRLALIFFSEEDEQTHQVASSIWSRFNWHHTCTHTLISTLRLISTQFTLCAEFYIVGSNRCLIDVDPLIH